jgi:hypothetical protein
LDGFGADYWGSELGVSKVMDGIDYM